MMNSASPNTIPQRPFIRQLERWLVGLAMMVIAYLLEKAVLRSIRRDGRKSSSQDRTAS
jgi:glutathione S-transferase